MLPETMDDQAAVSVTSEVDAAAAAVAAMEAADAATAQCQQQAVPASPLCRVCGSGNEHGRPMVRFFPVERDVLAAASDVLSFSEDISLHVFCGKTASILPNSIYPEMEILTKAGLKNKHGTGLDVSQALTKTRCAILQQPGTKEKHFYLIREFEAILAAIRQEFLPVGALHYEDDPLLQLVTLRASSSSHRDRRKPIPTKAAAGKFQKGRANEESITSGQMTEDGKRVVCDCGGTHLPQGTSKGTDSWRKHVMSRRHQNWMEENCHGV